MRYVESLMTRADLIDHTKLVYSPEQQKAVTFRTYPKDSKNKTTLFTEKTPCGPVSKGLNEAFGSYRVTRAELIIHLCSVRGIRFAPVEHFRTDLL